MLWAHFLKNITAFNALRHIFALSCVREAIAEVYGADVAETVTIQYGGSMNAANADELVAKVNVDGGLIGGASLKTDKFTAIVKAANA